MTDPTVSGWQLLALSDDLREEITPLRVGRRSLMAVRRDGAVRVYDATCPHRGAHLGHGGVLGDGFVTCPFHNRRIRLGDETASVFSVAEHPAAQVGDAVFVNVGNGPDRGLRDLLDDLARTHEIVPALTTAVRAPASLIIENAFDADHFVPVHGIRRAIGMQVGKGDGGELVVEGQLVAPNPPPWVDAPLGPYPERFYARAFSPYLVLTEIGPPGESPLVITGATPVDDGCVARVVFAIPPSTDGRVRPPEHVAGLVHGTRRAFGQDIEIWEHLDPDAVEMFDLRDGAVLAFRDFCAAAGS